MTDEERQWAADLATVAPGYSNMTREELVALARRYPTDEGLQALAAGQPTRGAINAAAGRDEEAKAEAHYAKLRANANAASGDAALRRYPTMRKP